MRTKDLALGVDALDVVLDPEADAVDVEATPEPVDVDANVEVGELTTIISDPRLGNDLKLPSDFMSPTVSTVLGGAMGICRLISSSDMEATGTVTGVFNV